MASLTGFHHHFYQPPRENPWLGSVSNEWTAWPYHDWNERITAECYRAMVAVALPGGEDGSTELMTPLASSSFDIGPTLHQWLERHAPDVDRAVTFEVSSEGTSPDLAVIAAPFVHAILPLASRADRERLVAWGIADYCHRFSMRPKGMWLPETAVDLETLEIIAEQGIDYTVLLPSQAARVRAPDGEWRDIDETTLDTSRPYVVRLSGDRSIVVVFGHRELSQRVAFGDLTNDGTKLAVEMMNALKGHEGGAVLLVADGETYGHHHHFADIGLAWAMRHLERHYDVETSLGEWLANQTPTWEVELPSVSSWSCAHGVERWRSDCGCTTGSQPGWNQSWRAPLRDALDWLRHAIAAPLETALGQHVVSTHDVLTEYGNVVAGVTGPAAFAERFATHPGDPGQARTILELCEIYRNVLFSFTSCAWFFADAADIETAIVLRYAAVAMEGMERVLGVRLEEEFLARLVHVRSNVPGIDGVTLWHRACDEYRFDETTIAAGFAIEHVAAPRGSRLTRGTWTATVESIGDGRLHVELLHEPTLRGSSYVAHCERIGTLSARVHVRVDGDESSRTFELNELGADVIAAVATAWLIGPDSADYEEALNLLVTELLMRRANQDDVGVLIALASAPRCVTPIGEASIRRALLAIVGRGVTGLDFGGAAALATAVGLGDLVRGISSLTSGG